MICADFSTRIYKRLNITNLCLPSVSLVITSHHTLRVSIVLAPENCGRRQNGTEKNKRDLSVKRRWGAKRSGSLTSDNDQGISYEGCVTWTYKFVKKKEDISYVCLLKRVDKSITIMEKKNRTREKDKKT